MKCPGCQAHVKTTKSRSFSRKEIEAEEVGGLRFPKRVTTVSYPNTVCGVCGREISRDGPEESESVSS